jgi:DNA polymerase I-like protein with 3'-5' exonuclease and polymerase domains
VRTFNNKFHIFEYKTIYITSVKEAEKVLQTFSYTEIYGFDLEVGKKEEWKELKQAGLDPKLSNIRLVQIYSAAQQIVWVFDVFVIPISIFEDIFKNGRFICHNGIYEIKMLTHAGYPNMNIGCSMLLSQLVSCAEHESGEKELELPDEDDDEEDKVPGDGLAKYRLISHSLDAVTARLFGVNVSKVHQTSNWDAEVLSVEQIAYAGLDALLTYECGMLLEVALKKHKMVKIYKLQKDMQHVIAHMELAGMPVDWDYHKGLIANWEIEEKVAKARCDPFFGETNMRSSPQMGAWLEGYLNQINKPALLEIWPRTPKGKVSFTKTGITIFRELPAIGALLEYKRYTKLLSTYGESLEKIRHPITSRLHTSYTLGKTRTGRTSSRNPNIQNMPRNTDFRNMFRSDHGSILVVSDFSQIELRVQAELSQDPMMLDVFKNGGDIYCTLATAMYGVRVTKADKERRFAGKTCQLAYAYGMGPTKGMQYGANVGVIQPMEFWEEAYNTYHKTYRVYSDWCNKTRRHAEKLGWVSTMMGKRRKLGEEELYTRAPNHIIQGTSAELMMKALLLCRDRLEEGMEINATVHDEIVLSVNDLLASKAISILSSSMNDSWTSMFPKSVCKNVADAASGERWGDIKKEL